MNPFGWGGKVGEEGLWKISWWKEDDKNVINCWQRSGSWQWCGANGHKTEDRVPESERSSRHRETFAFRQTSGKIGFSIITFFCFFQREASSFYYEETFS